MVNCLIKIAPSMLACDFSRMGEEIVAVEKAGADYIHWDVMDGHFVPNISIGIPIIEAMRPLTKLTFDVHLMVEDAIRFVPIFAKIGSDIITVHVETEKNLLETLTLINKLGKKAGIALSVETSIDKISDECLKKASMILIASIHLGFSFQEYIPIENKIRELSQRIKKLGLTVDIEVDGGINLQTVPTVVKAGATVLVAGKSVFKNKESDYAEAIKLLRSSAEGALNGS